jgi:RNA polymerase sigma factor (TIGR02999 family)
MAKPGALLAVAAKTMRRILVESARRKHRQKRGGDVVLVTLDETQVVGQQKSADLVGLNDALTALAAVNPRMSQVVELGFFGGLSVEETADILNVSPETVMRDWKTAKVWLLRELSETKPPEHRQTDHG